jgi:hypothetical protein
MNNEDGNTYMGIGKKAPLKPEPIIPVDPVSPDDGGIIPPVAKDNIAMICLTVAIICVTFAICYMLYRKR